ncbi:MAG: ABC transporter substrate-binding protein [Parvibaculaceae bacterium]
MDRERLTKIVPPVALDRRSFLGAAFALGVAAGLTPARAQPKSGGLLRMGLGSGETQDDLDPATVNNPMTQVMSFSLRNCLVEIDRDNNAVPELAESWSVDKGAKRWVLKVRDGVQFHDGKPFTAADAVYSIDYHRGQNSKSAAKPLLASIESVRADGRDLIIDLTEGSADFPFVLADYHLHMIPEGTKDFRNGMGTGPFLLESFDPGVRARLKKNPNYWKAGKGHFDEVEILSLKDVAARQNALITREVDLIDNLAPNITKLLEKQPGITVNVINGMQHYSFPMHCDTPPFDNVDVRIALKLAIDREDMVRKILSGYGKIGNDQPISSVNRYFDKSIPQYVYDPDKAIFHLKKAGAEGLKVQLHASDAAYAGAVDSAQLYREHAAKAGIDLEVVSEPADGYWSNVWLKKPWMITIWYGRPTEDWMFTMAYAAQAEWNDSRWNNPRFEQLLKDARAELDDNKRRTMYGDMQRLLHDQGGAVIPAFAAYLQAHNGTIASDGIATNYPLDGFRLTERWWRA